MGVFGIITWVDPSKTQIFLELLEDVYVNIFSSSPGTTLVLLGIAEVYPDYFAKRVK